jgi:uncharacterized protein
MGLIISLFVGTVFSSMPASSDVRKLEPDWVVLEAIKPGLAAYDSNNYEKANRLLMPLAELGNPYAQHYVARIYLKREEHVNAFPWFLKSANQGYDPSQLQVALLLLNGKGTQRDYTKAVIWLKYAAAQNNELAQGVLAEMYYEGKGVPTDLVEAYKWISIASSPEPGRDPDPLNQTLTGFKEVLTLEMTRSQIEEGDAQALKWLRGE